MKQDLFYKDLHYDGKSWSSTKKKYSNYKLATDANLRLKDLLSSFEERLVIKASEDENSID